MSREEGRAGGGRGRTKAASQGRSRVERSVGQIGEMEGQGVVFRLNSKDSDKMLRGSSPDRESGRVVMRHLATTSLLMTKAATSCDPLYDLGFPQGSWGSQRGLRRAGSGGGGAALRALEAGLTPEGFPASPRLLSLLRMLRGEAREARAGGGSRSSSLVPSSVPPPGSGQWSCPWSRIHRP